MKQPTPTERREAYEKFNRIMAYAFLWTPRQNNLWLHGIYLQIASEHRKDML